MTETRGRPPTDERMALLTMRIGESFFSTKRRETLYELARSMATEVGILEDEEDGKKGWRVWKKGQVGERVPRRRKQKKDKESS